MFLDVDGTLLAIAEDPARVRVGERLRRLLGRLAPRLDGALALISGRSLADLDRLFRPLRLAASGQHGAELRDASGRIRRLAAPAAVGSIAGALRAFAATHPGVILEDKGHSLALHYRRVPEVREEARALVERLVDGRGDLKVLHGKMVFEIKARDVDKGRAIASFMGMPPFRGRRPVFLGDDATDEEGFPVVNRMDGISVRVGRDGGPTAARYRLADVAAVIDWLDRVARVLEKGEAR